ncbi:MAG TPA: hypothetical protein VHZ97_26960 [Pseudonocardiaceae bacterium]|nr:hypothetical protein [Pseudonocardiaceae bacterium]
MAELKPPADLLVEALEHLPAEDRKRVTAWVLTRVTRQYASWMSREGGTTTPQARRMPYATYSHDAPVPDAVLFAGNTLKGDYQVVPVRLPAEQHAQLRDWCAENGFAMATVIRGLLTRFLAGQEGDQPD